VNLNNIAKLNILLTSITIQKACNCTFNFVFVVNLNYIAKLNILLTSMPIQRLAIVIDSLVYLSSFIYRINKLIQWSWSKWIKLFILEDYLGISYILLHTQYIYCNKIIIIKKTCHKPPSKGFVQSIINRAIQLSPQLSLHTRATTWWMVESL